MDLFLGSQGLGALPGWLDELPRRPRHAVLVPTAGNPMPATPWVEVAESALSAAGLTVDRLDLEPASADEVAAALARAELVFVTGGHPIFLLQHAQRTGFARRVAEAVRAGTLAYAGMSAGAALVSANLARYRLDDDPGRVSDTAGLGLVGFYPLSHANRGREEAYARIIAEDGDRYEFVPMRDDEAIIVRGSTWRKLPSDARRDPIKVVAYDTGWPDVFEQQRARVESALGPWLAGPVEHIGSTSVPGLPAKPIIDMLALVPDFTAAGIPGAMAEIGWVHAPEPGDGPARKWSFCYPDLSWRTHHLHIFEYASERWPMLLTFRDHLRDHPEDAAEYGRIKAELAAADDRDRPRYRAGKAPYIEDLLRRAG